jgi:hypothetical protein
MKTSATKLFWIVTLLAVRLAAQTSAGRITGSITDSSGGVIPNATVTAKNSETGIVTPATSNHEGIYVLYPLPPGTYSVTVETPGFRSERIDGIIVDLVRIVPAQRVTLKLEGS